MDVNQVNRKNKKPCQNCGFDMSLISTQLMVASNEHGTTHYENQYQERCARCNNLKYGSITPIKRGIGEWIKKKSTGKK